MANVALKWVLPTTRESGRPLAAEEIKHVLIELSADGGANYGVVGEFPVGTLETVLTELEPGTWFARGTVVDQKNRASGPFISSIPIADETPPSALLSLELVLA